MSLSSTAGAAWAAGLDALAQLQAEAAVAYAKEARVLCGLAETSTRDGWRAAAPFEVVIMEVAGTCVVGQATAHARLTDAEHLVTHLRQTLDRLDAGTLGVPQARVLVGETRHLDEVTCREVEDQVLPVAAELPAGALRSRVRRVVLTLDAAAAARRAAKARGDQRVWVKQAQEDGMSLLMALVPSEQAAAVMLSLTEQARVLKAALRDGRTADQLRTDLLVELLTGERVAPVVARPSAADATRRPVADGRPTGPGAEGPTAEPPHRVVVVRPPQVVLHVPLATALGVSEAPGQIDGGGLMCAAQVRELLVTAELRALFVDARTGKPVAARRAPLRGIGRGAAPLTADQLRALLRDVVLTAVPEPADEPEPQHDPSAGLAHFVRLRDGHCDGPGCSVPAARCELDHHDPYPSGPTSRSNLRARSQRCHHAKHHSFTVVNAPDGTTRWTGPSTRTYRVHPRWHAPPEVGAGVRLPAPAAQAARDRRLLATARTGDANAPP